MKNNQTIACFIALLFVVMVISCNLFSKSEDSKNSNVNVGGNGNSNTTNNNLDSITPYPAQNCPTGNFRVNDLTGDKYKVYEGCTLTFYGKLLSIKDGEASLVDESERTDLVREEYEIRSRAISCSGDFSDNNNYQIGQKLEELKRQKQFGNLPSVTYKATVKTTNGYTSLKDCVMTDFKR